MERLRFILSLFLGAACLFLNSCASQQLDAHQSKILVSVEDQTMVLSQHGQPVKAYKISTSKFGLGDTPHSMRTPLGKMKVAKKIGGNQPKGAVFKGRRPTGEVLPPNAPGRDPIVTRIMWLKGTERRNKNAFHRYIYIHGTPEERTIGEAASYGCIRMRSQDIVDLYSRIGVNAEVKVVEESLMKLPTAFKQRSFVKSIEKQEVVKPEQNA
ncbi:L,D-transpeptidase family protein [Rubritalea spongiae]|uniref:L,D-transpeptidase family protein n=1 Tax=Rubritalea spongiae TaxID=430797 RepID=A0ABW5E0A2_9BACT